MKRLAVAATAAALLMPVAAAVPAQAQPLPAVASVSTGTSLSAARSSAISYANKYSRQARSVSWRQKDRNANHLSKLTARAHMPSARRAALISRTQQGTMYRWGGTTPRGFDCSGFTRYVYKKSGKNLPRTAAQQARATKRVKRPAPGDLVFFGGRNAYHVGIYVGNNRMIHSPRSGKSIQVSKIWRGASYGRVR